MIKAKFAKIAQKIGDTYRDPFTEDQFNVWYEQFKNEDYQVVQQATDLLLSEYKYFPVPATLWEYIKRVKDGEAIREGREQVKPQPRSPEDVTREGKWTLFLCWLAEKRKYPKTDDEVLKMKKEFDEKYSNWQPSGRRKKRGRGPEPVGAILKDTFKKPLKEV